jgi:acetyltransferase-like isoleucine patch superfamily enzyme
MNEERTTTMKERIQRHPFLKKVMYRFLMHPVKTRPNWWIRPFRFLYMQTGKGSVIYRSVRADITPFHPFRLGKRSVIEDYSCINNAVGEVIIGDDSRVGLHNTIIGPVRIGNQVNLAQGVILSGLNHVFNNSHTPICQQGVSTNSIVIDDDVWIGGNAVVVAGIHIGRHSVVGAGSVVTKDVPAFTVVAGNPARVIKEIPHNE